MTAPPHLRRWVTLVVLGIVLVAALAAGLMLRDALVAQRALERGRADLSRARTAITEGDLPAARARLATAQESTATARAATSGPLWRLTRHLPLLGPTITAISTTADVSDQVASRVLPSLVGAANGLDLPALRNGDGLRLGPLAAAAPTLARAAREVAAQDRRIAGLKGPLPARVREGVSLLGDQLDQLTASLRSGAAVAELVPPLLGDSGRKRYLVVIENPAEARGTGGLIGAYGVLVADHGQVSLSRLGPNGDLASASSLPVDLGPDFAALYGNDPALWGNANLSPHFPDAATIWLELWRRQFGERLDGVIATDPIALGHLVGAVGPVTLPDGTQLTGATTATFVMQDAYRRFPTAKEAPARDRLLVQVGRAAVERILSPTADTGALVGALRSSVAEGRLLAFSTDDALERQLLATSVGGGLDGSPGPALSVIVNNGAANKLDVYLDRHVTWQLGPCYGGRRGARITVRLTNTAPPTGLPPYVTGQPIRSEPGGPALPRGSNRELVTVFTSRGSRLTGAELDGRPVGVGTGRLHGRTATTVTMDLAPGGASTLVLQTTEPAATGRPLVQTQPLVRPQETVVDGRSCRPSSR